MKQLIAFLFIPVIISCSTKNDRPAPDPLFLSIDSVVNSVADTARFNGNVLVAVGGKIIYQKSKGFANYDTKELLNDSSVFELASVSKQFTAMAIMMLMEQGRLKYEDDVRKYIPELPYEGVTIRHFLTHTSGIPDYMEQFSKGWDPTTIAYNDDIIKLLSKNKPAILFKPGDKWEYSNTAYAMLATIIERVSKQPYGEFLNEHIFSPAHMTHTRTYNTRRSKHEIIPNYAYGFVYSDSLKRFALPDSLKEYSYVITLDGIQGDGIVNSTTTDLFLWDQLLYTETFVKSSTLREAFEPVKLNDGSSYPYGFGWFIQNDSIQGKRVVHTGGWPGYGNYITRFIDKNKCIVILTNNDGFGRRTIAEEILKRLN